MAKPRTIQFITELRIGTFDPTAAGALPRGSSMLIFGKRAAGKTVLTRDLLRKLGHAREFVFSATSHINEGYIPDVYGALERQDLDQIVNEQGDAAIVFSDDIFTASQNQVKALLDFPNRRQTMIVESTRWSKMNQGFDFLFLPSGLDDQTLQAVHADYMAVYMGRSKLPYNAFRKVIASLEPYEFLVWDAKEFFASGCRVDKAASVYKATMPVRTPKKYSDYY